MAFTLFMTSILRIARSTVNIQRPASFQEILSDTITLHVLSFSVDGASNAPYPDSHFLNFCIDYCQKNAIAAVISENDIGSLIAAYCNEKLGISGSSVESIFLCLHKQLTKQITGCPIPSTLWNIWEESPKTPFPFYIKAPYSSFGRLGFEIHAQEDLDRITPVIQKKLPIMNAPIYEILNKTDIPKKYPTAVEDCVAIEPLIHAPQVTVEGYVYNNTVVPLFITDTNFFPGDFTLFDNFSLPSKHPEATTQKIREQTIADVTCVQLNQTFFNVEYWIIDGEPVLIEINSRSAYCFRYLYKDSYNFELGAAIAELSLEKEPGIQAYTGITTGQFNIFRSQIAEYQQLFELQKLIPNTSIRVKPNIYRQDKNDHGLLAAQFELAGPSYAALYEQVTAIRNALKQNEKLPTLSADIYPLHSEINQKF
ncbi:hypothetical protein KA082_01845 [Candidatus Woesebacteria bacterium]|nr:hypothetical protein [Candidatus Woesebacteria bacterium]